MTSSCSPGGRERRRAACVSCGTEYVLRVDGTTRRHLSNSPTGWVRECPGSLKVPAPHIHRCDCGARWDEDA